MLAKGLILAIGNGNGRCEVIGQWYATVSERAVGGGLWWHLYVDREVVGRSQE